VQNSGVIEKDGVPTQKKHINLKYIVTAFFKLKSKNIRKYSEFYKFVKLKTTLRNKCMYMWYDEK